MKKFTDCPIGLGINHIEQEETIAHHWNQCIDLGVDSSEPIEVSETMVHNFNHTNYQTGLSIVNTEHAEEIDGKWKLTDKAIEKCKKYLKI